MPNHSKPPGTRRRRNLDQPQWVLLPAAGRPGEPPALPGQAGFTLETIEWWRTVWRSPMAVMYVEADVAPLARCARLVELEAVGELNATQLGELRFLEDRFGLNPKARKALFWAIAPQSAVPLRDEVDTVDDEVEAQREARRRRLGEA